MDPGIVTLFRKYDPVMRMIISRDSGLLNDYFSVSKGQLIDLYAFASYEGEADCNSVSVIEEHDEHSGFDITKEIPTITSLDEMRSYTRNLYIIDDYMSSDEKYNNFRKEMYNILLSCFTIPECRNYEIRFKFNKEDKKTFKLPFRMFIINIILWYPFIELRAFHVLNEDRIFRDKEKLPEVNEYINSCILPVLKYHQVSNETTNYSISEVLYNLRDISRDYSIIMGIDFSIPLFLKLYNEHEDIKEIMEFTFDNSVQPHEAEMKLTQLQNTFIDKVKAMNDNHLGLVLRAGTGVKAKQLAEFAIAQGLKPDLSGKTVPKVNSNSTLIRGAEKPSELYIEALGARKSLILNKKTMGSAGYFGKTVLMSTRKLEMSKDVVDCGSKHLVCYDVNNGKVLKKLSGKYYKMNPDDDELKLVDYKEDKHLIGKKIYVRSAVTCALGGNCVCSRCIGETASTNADIAGGISAFESEEVTKVVNQNILSAKHLLVTISEMIQFNPEFYKFFTIMGDEINPLIDENKEVPNLDDYALYVDPNDIQKADDYDEDSLYNTMIPSGRFYVRNLKDPKEDDILIKLTEEKEIFIAEETSTLLKKYNCVIPFSELTDDMKLFEVSVINNELTKPLHDLMHILNRQSKDGSNQTIDEICNNLLGLIIEAKINASVVAVELIVNQLIRSVANPYERPDFSKDILEPYEIYTVTKSLERNKSPLIGLAYQNIKRQILSNDLFEMRDEPSYIDPFFKQTVSMKNIKRYHNEAYKHKNGYRKQKYH